MTATGPLSVHHEQISSTRVTQSKQPPSWFSLPAPIRAIFDTFPLITYDENELPQRVSRSRSQNTLHMFALADASDDVNLSPNPACLKWQAYLLAKRIPFQTVSANNHASPSGALPFVLPAVRSRKEPQPQAISSSKIQRWAENQGTTEEKTDLRLEAYMSLIDQSIRNAWLYYLYLQPRNFESVARRLYVETASSNPLVQATLAHQLQAAAREQLLRTRSFIDQEDIYQSADAAFSSLATVFAGQKFFNGSDAPGLFDVSLFAYTHLLLNLAKRERDAPVWTNEALLEILLRHQSLVQHRQRVLDYCVGT
ncbi:hypothetical protein LTR70_003566 [Exophiala xenobiotica]|uniref:Mitochondrial outer membrane protein n=1 Tax=Lithohypha guttulata TaxID=1690604 RepID=A0ABR0KFX4_9EURO|nr:hypothetical protein LTR24_003114 [Lithohypha guttulata]KAK5322945.1 hypothetical protein LTR70_003566 [Exophiala xenobiotica]